MTYSFRDYHLLNLLEEYGYTSQPLDVAISRYFRAHKALGSKDRSELAEAAYSLIRWKGSLEALLPGKGWLDLLAFYRSSRWEEARRSLSPHLAVSFPLSLYESLCRDYGPDKANALCLISNESAPTCVRVNTLKCNRDQLLARWQPHYNIEPASVSPDGIVFREKIHFYSLPEFREGLFEVQDEGSQLVAALVQAEPGQLVLDYCAGAGGKSLAIAPHLQGRGQLFLHDIRRHALLEAKERLKRAGIQNAQLLSEESPTWAKSKGKLDWVLVDAPCSGTGTLRRNPDMKWRFNEEMVRQLIGKQRTIFERALSFVKPTGRIVYATCSILASENQEQVRHFCSHYNLEHYGVPLQTLPSSGGMDGFFAAVLARR